MPAPTVTIYLNTGTEAAPVWTEVLSTHTVYFAGPNTISSVIDPVVKPSTGCKVAEQLWFGVTTYTKCTTYDGTVNVLINILRVLFATNPTATAPILTAYDSSTARTATKEMLAGTPGTSNKSFLKAKETTGGVPAANWATCGLGVAGSVDPNDLKGDTDYVQCASAAAAGADKKFNIVCFVPSDAGTGTTGHDPVISVKYTYT